jgi:transposase
MIWASAPRLFFLRDLLDPAGEKILLMIPVNRGGITIAACEEMTLTRQTRQRHSPAFKAKMAVAAIKGEKTSIELAQDVDVRPIQINQSRDRLLMGATGVFAAKPVAQPAIDVKTRHAKIGEPALGPMPRTRHGSRLRCLARGKAGRRGWHGIGAEDAQRRSPSPPAKAQPSPAA